MMRRYVTTCKYKVYFSFTQDFKRPNFNNLIDKLGRFVVQVVPYRRITFRSPHAQQRFPRLRQPASAAFRYAGKLWGRRESFFSRAGYTNNTIHMLTLLYGRLLAPQLRFAPANVGERASAGILRAAARGRNAKRSYSAGIMFSARLALRQPEATGRASTASTGKLL